MSKHRSTGFTLIELMIAVAVVAILSAIALPSYQEYLRRGRRADTQSFMSDLVARQQQRLLDRRSYAVDIQSAPGAGGLGIPIPSKVSSYYTVTIAADNDARPPAFTITATPAGAQASDKCGTLTINQAGTKTPTTGNCW